MCRRGWDLRLGANTWSGVIARDKTAGKGLGPFFSPGSPSVTGPDFQGEGGGWVSSFLISSNLKIFLNYDQIGSLFARAFSSNTPRVRLKRVFS